MITPTVWVLIAQLADHCSADEEVMGSNLFKATIFSWVNLQEYKILFTRKNLSLFEQGTMSTIII